MPKSKREKIVPLSCIEKNQKETKNNLIQKTREYLDTYKYIYLFECQTMRNSFLKSLREALPDSKFLLGKNKVVIRAFGKDESDEVKPKLSELSQHLVGSVGLLFSNSERDELEQAIASYESQDYARPGYKASITVELDQGPLQVIGAVEPYPMPHTQQSYLRSLGMDTELKNGIISLSKKFTVCKEGDVLNVNQTNILRALEIKLASVSLKFLGVYDESSGWMSFEEKSE